MRFCRRRGIRVSIRSFRCMWMMEKIVCCFVGMGGGWLGGRWLVFWSLLRWARENISFLAIVGWEMNVFLVC